MVTFRHGKFIDKAIESVMEQDEPSVELVIGDDRSDDDTYTRAKEWATRYPDKIRLHEELPDKLLGRPNFNRTLGSCRGKYISHLDGDDWFMEKHKLRVQCDLLDANPQMSGCLTASQEYDHEGNPQGEPVRIDAPTGQLTLLDFALFNRACSNAVVWRRGLRHPFPEWWWKTPVGDWPMHMLHLERGPFGYIDEVMAAHREHPGGAWSSKTPLECLQIVMDCQGAFIDNLEEETVNLIKPTLLHGRWRETLAETRGGDPERALKMFEWLAKYGRHPKFTTRCRIALYHFLARIKG